MFAFIAAISQVGGILIDKIILTRRQVETRVYIPILFLFLAILTAILYPFIGSVQSGFFQLKYIAIFIVMLFVAIFWNIFYYRGVQAEKVHEYEMIIMFQPLLTILLAALFLKGERNIHIIIIALIASIALIFSHLKKAHLEVSAGSKSLIVATILMSAELILLKELLNVFSPVALYFFRTGIIFIFFYLFYRPQVNKIASTNLWLILATSFLGVAQMVSKFYGFDKYGVVYTSLVLILSPVLVYLLSTIFLHERLKARAVISFLIILACIGYATIFGK